MKKEIVYRILKNIVAILFLLFMIFNSLLSFHKTAIFPNDYRETLYYITDNIIVNILLLMVFVIFMLVITKYFIKKINVKRLLLLSMIFIFILSMLFSILRRDYVQFDPFNVIDQASNFIRGNFTGLDKGENYLYIYSHQITTVFVFQVILYLFGRATFILYLMQCFSISYILFMLYKISNILFNNKKVNYMTIALTILCFPLIFYVAFVYGLLPGMFLVLISFYNFIKYIKLKKWYFLVISAFSINIAILLIGNNLINLLSIICVVIIILIKKFDINLIYYVGLLLFLMISFKSIIFNYYEIESGKNIPNGVNKITWIAMGLQEGDREAGWWNGFNYDIMPETEYNEDEIKKISIDSIKQRLNVFRKNPSYALDFYKRKYYNQFLDPTYQILVITAPQKDFDNTNKLESIKNNILKELYFGNIKIVVEKIMKIYQIFIYLFTTIFGYVFIRNKMEELYLLIPLSFLGGTIFHMIWEAKSRYIFPYFIFLIPLASFGIIYFKDNVLVKLKNIGGK